MDYPFSPRHGFMSRRVFPASLLGVALLSGCASAPSQAALASNPFPAWSASDAEYRFYPGDVFKLDVRTAPEFSGEITVAPDGRIALAGLGRFMAADRTVSELQASLEHELSHELRDPALAITPLSFKSQQIFVGGEVKEPGVYDLPGEIGPLQAILLAGGWTEKGKPADVVLMRRAPGGGVITRHIDARGELNANALQDIGPLRRFDVVYVSRKRIADENLFMQQFIRDALPINFGLVYDLARLN